MQDSDPLYFVFDSDLLLTHTTKRRPNQGVLFLSCSDLPELLALEFASALFTIGPTVIKQTEGLGMGPPASPALAVLTTKWIRSSWTCVIPRDDIYTTTQYMDDIITLHAGTRTNPTERYTSSLQAHNMNLITTDSDVTHFQYLQYKVTLGTDTPTILYSPKYKLRYLCYTPHIHRGTYIRWALSQLCAIYDSCHTTTDLVASITPYLALWHRRRWPGQVIRAALAWFVQKRFHSHRQRWQNTFWQLYTQIKFVHAR